jgi:hypothetical protein
MESWQQDRMGMLAGIVRLYAARAREKAGRRDGADAGSAHPDTKHAHTDADRARADADAKAHAVDYEADADLAHADHDAR